MTNIRHFDIIVLSNERKRTSIMFYKFTKFIRDNGDINTIGSTDIYRHLNYKVIVSDGGYNQMLVKLDGNDNLLWSVNFIYPRTIYNNITEEEFIAEYKTTKHKTLQKAKEMYDEYAQLVSIKSEYIEIETFLNSEYEKLNDVMDYDTYLKMMVLIKHYYSLCYEPGDEHVNVELFNMVYQTNMSTENFVLFHDAIKAIVTK